MIHSDCQLLDDYLDDYLDGKLSPIEMRRFTQHLADCENCQEALAQQQWLDQLLVQSSDLAPLPAELATISLSPPPRPFPWPAIMATALAASLLLAFSLWDGPANDVRDPLAQETESTATDEAPDEALVQLDAPQAPIATFLAEDDVIVVPVESDSPEVTIIQVYPTAQARSRWRREALLHASFVSNTGG